MSELKECPFCGTTDEWISKLDGIARCAECGCTCKVEHWNTRNHTRAIEKIEACIMETKGSMTVGYNNGLRHAIAILKEGE